MTRLALFLEPFSLKLSILESGDARAAHVHLVRLALVCLENAEDSSVG